MRLNIYLWFIRVQHKLFFTTSPIIQDTQDTLTAFTSIPPWVLMLSCLLKFYIFSSHNALQLCFVQSNFIFKIVLLRYNRYTKNFTYVTCTIWWVWSYANIHDTFTLCFWFLFQNWFEYSLYFPSCLLFSLHFMPSFHSMFSFVILFFLPKIFLYCVFWYWFTGHQFSLFVRKPLNSTFISAEYF